MPSTTKRSPLREIKGILISLEISDSVRNQIVTLCHRVHDDEWSGTLFYTVEGDFGTEGFKMIAKEIYLQDIGTSSYTEYDPSNPEFIKFMMSRPDLMEMRVGHIHSHNKMSVFFSGTDNDELITNSEFHNYYLSLIVNNRNHMTAKVAFRGKSESEISTKIFFKDTDGTEKMRDIITKKEEVAVYAYDCHITWSSYLVDDNFDTRYFELIEQVRKKREEAEKARKTSSVRVVESGTSIVLPRSQQGFDGAKRYREAGLFDEEWLNEKKEKKEKKKEDKGKSKVGTGVDPHTFSMLSKLVTLDPLYEGQLWKALHVINGQFYGADSNADPNYYFDQIEKRAFIFYMDVFPNDRNLVGYPKAVADCIQILESHEEEFPKLLPNIITALKMTVDE